MSEGVNEQSVGGITVLTIDTARYPGLAAPARAALSAALTRVCDASSARAIVLAARGRGYPASPDDDEDALPETDREPSASALIAQVEGMPVPVFAAMHGEVTGLGLELGLAAHYRIADRRTRLGFPGLSIGLLPVAGGVQRLCRAIGPVVALDMLLTGRLIDAEKARAAGLVDHVADAPLPKFTIDTVRDRLGQGGGPRPMSGMDGRLRDRKTLLSALSARRRELAPEPEGARARALDCVEASLLLPYEAAIGAERAASEDLRASAASRALRHLKRAERLALHPPGQGRVAPQPVSQVGIVGGGQIGGGLAASCLEAGIPVTLVEKSIEHLEHAVERLIDLFEREIARGRIDEAGRDARLGRLNGTTDPAALAAADVVVECVTEDADEKRRVIGMLDTVMKRGALLATTTATLDIDGLAAATSRPEDVVGLSLFPPVMLSPLAEVVIALETSDGALATAWEFARLLGKSAIPAAVAEGYVVSQVVGAARAAAEWCVFDGASVPEVDAALRAYGLPLGPFEAWDLDGLDRPGGGAKGSPGLAARLCATGRSGRRAGRGWYLYGPGTVRGREDPEVSETVRAARAEAGSGSTPPGADLIRRRVLAAMVNAGARLLSDGVAHRPADIDLGVVLASRFPRRSGGPMMAADLTGLLRIKRDLDEFRGSAAGGAFWTAEPLLVGLVKNGLNFEDLNRDPDRVQDLV